MRDYTLTHLSNAALVHNLSELVSRDRRTTAELLAHIAEVDDRQLYADAGYSSMYAYCVGAFHFSEDAAVKRITAARAARRFPVLLEALELGKIHLTAIWVLAPHLNEDNERVLLEAATHKKKAEIEAWLVARSITKPVTIRPCRIKPILARPVNPVPDQAGPELPFDFSLTDTPQGSAPMNTSPEESAPEERMSSDRSHSYVPGRIRQPEQSIESGVPGSTLPAHYRMQLTIPRTTHDKLRRVQALLGHAIPTGDVAQVLDRALDLMLEHLEKRKAGSKRAPTRRPSRSTNKRHVPADIRRAVWERDEGQCTFIGESGIRCGERTRLEFDHVRPVARGGTATVEGIRLRCRAHNQLEARRVFGAGLMQRKRREARLRRRYLRR